MKFQSPADQLAHARRIQDTMEESYTRIMDAVAAHGSLTVAERENLKDSGPRVARGVLEMLWSVDQIHSEVYKALRTMFPVNSSGSSSPVVVGPIETFSLCPHHFLPIVNRVVLGYIPSNNVIGLSKLPRIADALSRRAVVQEQLTSDIAQVLTTGKLWTGEAGEYHVYGPALSPNVAVNVRAVHHCMVCRGVRGRSLTETQALHGDFNTGVGSALSMFTRFVDRE